MAAREENEPLFKVGFTEGYLFDEERKCWSTLGARPFRCSVWYPANSGATEKTSTIGGLNEPLFVVGEVDDGTEYNRRIVAVLDNAVRNSLIAILFCQIN